MTWADDFASLIETWANEEGRDIDEGTFVRLTRTSSPFDRDRVFDALPTWAQRRIMATQGRR